MIWKKLILQFAFHCTTHSEVFVRLQFRLTALVVISCTVEKKEV